MAKKKKPVRRSDPNASFLPRRESSIPTKEEVDFFGKNWKQKAKKNKEGEWTWGEFEFPQIKKKKHRNTDGSFW